MYYPQGNTEKKLIMSYCITECNDKTYGIGCLQVCGNCKNNEPCHNVNGSCLNGCNNGWYSVKCDKGR